MDGIFIEPWILPLEPDLARLAMETADLAGLPALNAWPEQRKGGIGFQSLPPFLSWSGRQGEHRHLVLLQAREVGGLVPGARIQSLPPGWLAALDLRALAGPLARHPALGGAASVHVVHLPEPGVAEMRTLGEPGPAVVRAVLGRLTGLERWEIRHLRDGAE
jgi:hypothetical protein